MSDVATVETAAMERQEAMDTKPQDRFAGRGKFTGCRECGSNFGMYSTGREALEWLPREAIERLAPWYKDLSNNWVLYCPCLACNRKGEHVPDGFELITVPNVLGWVNDEQHDPMAPDYVALAAEPETAMAGQDSRESAGL